MTGCMHEQTGRAGRARPRTHPHPRPYRTYREDFKSRPDFCQRTRKEPARGSGFIGTYSHSMPVHAATALPAQAARARTRTRGSRESRGKTNNRALMPEPARRPKAEAWSHSCPPNLHALPASAQKHATILAVSFLATAAAGLRLLGCKRSVGACCVAVFPIFFSESLLCLC